MGTEGVGIAADAINVQSFTVDGAARSPGLGMLDRITVIARSIEPARGQIIVECFGRAWSAYWGNMGQREVRDFVRASNADYVANCLYRGARAAVTNQRVEKRDMAYLIDIVKAIQAAWPA